MPAVVARSLIAFAAFLSAAAPLGAQRADSALTVERIFASPELSARRLTGARWRPGVEAYTRLEPSTARGDAVELVQYDAESGRRDVILPASRLTVAGAAQPLAVEDYDWSPDGKRVLLFTNSARVWRQNTRGDYWLIDLASGPPRKLGGRAAKPSTLMFATFSPDGGRVAYVRENNLYVEDLATRRLTALTRDGSRTTINGTFDWVNEEEFALRNGFRWSPDGKRVAYWQLDASGERDFDLIDDTDSLYSYVVPVQYPKAGTTNAAVRVGVVSAAGGTTQWIATPGDPRNNYIARMEWAASSDEIVLQHLNRLQNTLTLMLGDARTGRARTVLVERDSAWVDVVNDLRWLDGGKSFTWVSERDGWRHLYVVSRDGRSIKLVTPGDFDIHNPASLFGAHEVLGVDEKAGLVYFTASPTNPTQLHLYNVRLDGTGTMQRVTPASAGGVHAYVISPSGRYALHSSSSFGAPPTTDLVRLPSHEVVRTLLDNAALKARIAAIPRGPAEFFRVDGGSGYPLDGWMIKPPAFDSTRSYPLLFYIYGEPGDQTVRDAWDGETYLWHLMLAQRGYLVASIDNSGTASPRGRVWRKRVYGAVGELASREQAFAARQLARRSYVDSTRIGVWGWSGGGSMTLNLLFRSPELYKTGMSVAPVADQRYYDTIYQERYMGLPQQNADGYRRGSPINFAKNLRGNLLLVHGSGDDNVHFQNSEALIDVLVAANKPFTMMAYPGRTHCICEGEGTTVHLFGLLTRYLKERMPAGW
ncbi:MAG: S9 family peptidase [Gemmatimonadaceae bacterium]